MRDAMIYCEGGREIINEHAKTFLYAIVNY
jgi:hypothetical protein